MGEQREDNPDALCLAYSCPYCKAAPGEPCVTVKGWARPPGQRVSWPHTGRNGPLWAARHGGYRSGTINAYRQVGSSLQAAREGAYWTELDAVPVLADDAVERYVEREADRWENT